MASRFLSGLFGKKQEADDAATPEAPSEEASGRDMASPPVEAPDETQDNAPLPAPEEILPPVSAQPKAAPQDAAPQQEKPQKKKGWLSRLRSGLSKSSNKLTEGVSAIFTKRKLDDETLDELTDLLISSDLGVPAATRITSALAAEKFDKDITGEEVREALSREVAATLSPLEAPLGVDGTRKPHILLMVGVNGAGKTTTIGKLARKFGDDGLKVMLAAGDTFRAAAIEQLQVWGARTNAPVIARSVGADAAGLAFDAVKEAQTAGIDVLMIDTAGRLQNKKELMEELAKIVRVIRKLDETAPHDVILTLDATVGQNALSQAQAFADIAGVTGLVMTKLDGTARGGVLVALADKFKLPVHFIGVGEGVDDLQKFDAAAFAVALCGLAQGDINGNGQEQA
ncbi:MAG: signal recognition particle-docking protein FtsY [Pseudomonadota bacterium]